MPEVQLRSVAAPLRLVGGSPGEVRFLSDARLLEAFVNHHDETAVEELVWRHGPMMLNICRRVLHDEHHAEDAFQVAFLAFVRSAGSIDKRQSLSSWLFKVAYRAAHRQRARLAKEPEQRVDIDNLASCPSSDALIWRELRPVLDDEINRLPEKFRGPIVLCYLQGRTTEEAAAALSCPKGTILSRLSRAREQLSSRLARRGLALSAGWLAVHLSTNASSAAVPAALVEATVKSAKTGVAGSAGCDLVKDLASLVAAPPHGVFHAIFLATLKTVAVLTVAAVGLAAGAGLCHWVVNDSEPTQQVGGELEAAGQPGDADSTSSSGEIGNR